VQAKIEKDTEKQKESIDKQKWKKQKLNPEKAIEQIWLTNSYIRGAIWSLVLGNRPRRLRVDAGVRIRSAGKILIGSRCWLKERVLIDGRSDLETGIEMGNKVTIRAGSYIDSYGCSGYVWFGIRV
jgi:acetyltransferase-like isoleucine patch superfamily enzyme